MLRRLLPVSVAVSIACTIGIAAVQGRQAPAASSEEQLKELVVMLEVRLAERTYNGAGIIAGTRGDQLYILTAKHVVREGLQRAESVRVRFRWLPGEAKDARLLDDFDDTLDIAVIAVAGLGSLSPPAFAWNALAPPAAIVPGQDVVPVGFPDGRAWFTPQLRSKVQEVTSQHVEFQGELHAGNSGGALVTSDWSIVSVVSQIRPPTNQSSRIDRALEKLRGWGYPVALRERQPAPGGGAPAVAAATSGGARTCAEVLASQPGAKDGVYAIDADGTDGPLPAFKVHCDMTHEGGGWTLVAFHRDGLSSIRVAEMVDPAEHGVLASERWQALRRSMTAGMMFVDENGLVSRLAATKLRAGNCADINGTNDLTRGPEGRLWHNESSGCTLTGQDYSLVALMKAGDHSNYGVIGASLFQMSNVTFDKWPYRDAQTSDAEQNALLYFIK